MLDQARMVDPTHSEWGPFMRPLADDAIRAWCPSGRPTHVEWIEAVKSRRLPFPGRAGGNCTVLYEDGRPAQIGYWAPQPTDGCLFLTDGSTLRGPSPCEGLHVCDGRVSEPLGMVGSLFEVGAEGSVQWLHLLLGGCAGRRAVLGVSVTPL